MLDRNEDASGPQIAEAMGWAPHTVRGFLAGLAKKGLKVAQGRGSRARPPGRAQQGRRQGELHSLPPG
jgi:predicted ArsR family transcriptional regulator